MYYTDLDLRKQLQRKVSNSSQAMHKATTMPATPSTTRITFSSNTIVGLPK